MSAADGTNHPYESVRDDMGAPVDAYHVREFEEQRSAALVTWRKKTKIMFLVQLVTCGCMLYSVYWYASIVGLIMTSVGMYGVFREKIEFIFVYLLLCVLVFFKDGSLVYLYTRSGHPTLEGWAVMVLLTALIDAVVVMPFSVYYGYFLYNSTNASLTYRQMTW